VCSDGGGQSFAFLSFPRTMADGHTVPCTVHISFFFWLSPQVKLGRGWGGCGKGLWGGSKWILLRLNGSLHTR
jgi:hypothetical protein